MLVLVNRKSKIAYWRNLVVFAALVALLAVLLLGIWLPYGAARAFLRPVRQPIDRTPAAWGLAYDEVMFLTVDGLRLRGWYVPSGNGATIILLHGKDDSRLDRMDESAVLARHGYGLLLYDQRGHGQSQGDLTTLGYREAQDVSAAVAYLRARAGVDRPGRTQRGQ